MRPVNLIPPEQRRGEKAPLRTGPLPYALVGALGVALLTITMLVLTGNSVKDREAELAGLEARETAARATADALSPYAQFASMSATRDQTVRSLAESRFDWERVMRELSLVIPDDVWLINATGSVAPGATSATGAAGNALRDGVTGPALELIGCAASQEAVAGFVAALQDIDGVTRVGVSSSQLGQSSNGTSAGGEGEADCRTRAFISRFEIIAAFDGVPAPASATPSESAPVPAADPAAAPESAEAADSAATQTAKADAAADIAPGVSP